MRSLGKRLIRGLVVITLCGLLAYISLIAGHRFPAFEIHLADAGFAVALETVFVYFVMEQLLEGARREKEQTEARVRDQGWRAARELFVSSVGKRLDELAKDWGWALNFMTSIGTRDLLDRLDERMNSFPSQLRQSLPDVVSKQMPPVSPGTESIVGEVQARPRSESIDRLLGAKLNHIVSRLEDILDAVDRSAVVVSPSMLDPLVALREALANDLRRIRDLRDLLANPTPEQASEVFSGASTASLSGKEYADTLGRLWNSIPASALSSYPRLDLLSAIPAKRQEQVREFLYVLFPEYDPKVIIRHADDQGGVGDLLS